MDILYQIGEVVIPGLLIVFIALIVLIFVVLIMGRILSAKTKTDTPAPQVSVDNATPAVQTAAPAPVVAAGIPGETVAAISAAVACYMHESAPGVSYTIQSISRPRQSRPVWGFAGMLQNTRPF
jgi:sodium pump decarboxylase gamma subunit